MSRKLDLAWWVLVSAVLKSCFLAIKAAVFPYRFVIGYQCHTALDNSFWGLISLVGIAGFVVVVKLLGAMCY